MKKVFRGLPSPEERLDCAVAIGNFDGVHRGHQALLHEVVEAAHARLLCPAVLTFEPHPREFFNPEDAPRRISSLHDKVEAIEACGIQRVYILRFNEHLASLSPYDFVKEILVDGLHARWVTVGENFRFGDKRAGDIKLLEQLGKEFHFEVHPMPMLYHTHAPCFSRRRYSDCQLHVRTSLHDQRPGSPRQTARTHARIPDDQSAYSAAAFQGQTCH